MPAKEEPPESTSKTYISRDYVRSKGVSVECFWIVLNNSTMLCKVPEAVAR